MAQSNEADVNDVAADVRKLSLSDEASLYAADTTGIEEKSASTACASVDSICAGLKEGKFKKVLVLTGAGISVSAGIPDFRSPGTGLYDNLQKYDLPHPESIFDIEYFREKPEPFNMLAKELFPGQFPPTPTHFFIKLLHDKGLLVRNYTQNIDGLEYLTGLPADKVMQCHGGFQGSHCIDCNKEYDISVVKKAVMADQIPKCTKCNGLVKPDITFFGEDLPPAFSRLVAKDFPECDLLIVMGTSLQVQPVAGLIDEVPQTAVRLLVNREKAGVQESLKDTSNPNRVMMLKLLGISLDTGFKFDSKDNTRDVFLQGDCDDGVRLLAKGCGWSAELEKLCTKGQSK